MDNLFSAFRLKKTTVVNLQRLKRAFELTHSQPLSNDFFMEKMIECIREHDKEVWETYCELTEVEEKHSSKG